MPEPTVPAQQATEGTFGGNLFSLKLQTVADVRFIELSTDYSTGCTSLTYEGVTELWSQYTDEPLILYLLSA